MITRVGTVSLFVNDQEKAKDFYVNVLGFEVRMDGPLNQDGSGSWLSVAPKGAETEVVLYKPDSNWEHYRQVIGKSQALTFEVDDLAATYADLKSKGVVFIIEPTEESWGKHAFFADPEGNQFLIVESPKF